VDCQNSILFRVVPATVLNNVTGLTSFQDFVFPLGNLYLCVQRHYVRDDYNTGTKRNQQSIATSKKAYEISSGDPMMILFSILESLISVSLLLLKVKAHFRFTFLLLISSHSLSLPMFPLTLLKVFR